MPAPAAETALAGHGMHVAAPAADHEPAAQLVHTALDAAAIADDAVPAAHGTQADAPADDHVPALQLMHAAAEARPAAADDVPAAHNMHTAGDVASPPAVGE